MAPKQQQPDMTMGEFLASSASLDVQMARKEYRSNSKGRKSLQVPGRGGLSRTPSPRQPSPSLGRRATLPSLSAVEKDEKEEEQPAMVGKRASLGNLVSGLFRKGGNESEGPDDSVLDDVTADKYVTSQTLKDALYAKDTVLVRGTWLVQHWKQGKGETGKSFGLPRRQEIEKNYPRAIWEVDELFQLEKEGKVSIVAVSHCWLGSGHPDPQGSHMDILCSVLEIVMAQTPLRDLALFVDWCSLHQQPRTPEEEGAFTRARANAHMWYLHQGTRVWMLTQVPSNMERSEAFDARGWPTIERALCDMLTSSNFLLDLGSWEPTISTWAQVISKCMYKRRVPRIPKEFHVELAKKHWGVAEDAEFAVHKYDEAFLEAIAAAKVLSFKGQGWDDDDVVLLATMLSQCGRLEKLSLVDNKITEKGLDVLLGALPKCETLRELWLTQNPVGRAKKDVREKFVETWVKTGRYQEQFRL